jgi:hypothetical protein
MSSSFAVVAIKTLRHQCEMYANGDTPSEPIEAECVAECLRQRDAAIEACRAIVNQWDAPDWIKTKARVAIEIAEAGGVA